MQGCHQIKGAKAQSQEDAEHKNTKDATQKHSL